MTSKLKRRRPPQFISERTASLDALIDDIMKEIEEAKGLNGKERWKRAFKTLTRDKKAMTAYCDAEQAQVFEHYYAMGENRNLKKLAEITRHGVGRLQKWRRKYNWEAKVVERNIKVADILEKKAISSIVNIKIEYSGIINSLIKEMIENMREYNSKVRAANKKAKSPKELLPYKSLIYSSEDFERLVKLDLLMRGDVTERKEQVIENKVNIIEKQIAEDEEMRNLLKELYERNRQYANANRKLTLVTSNAEKENVG